MACSSVSQRRSENLSWRQDLGHTQLAYVLECVMVMMYVVIVCFMGLRCCRHNLLLLSSSLGQEREVSVGVPAKALRESTGS